MQEALVRFLGPEDPLERDRLPTPVFWPREFHGVYSPWGCKELDTTERLSLSYFEEEKNNYYSQCLLSSYYALGAQYLCSISP